MSSSSKPGRIRGRADLDRDVVVAVGVGLAVGGRLALVGSCRRRAHEVEHDRVAHLDAAALDRLVARRALPQPRERLLDGRVIHRRRLAAQRDARVVARVDGRHRLEASP